jgi:DNA-binding transcriptional ArsR family regulator
MMPNTKVSLMLHPDRLQILTTISTRKMTAHDLAQELDIPLTSLYRHLNLLVEGGLLEIVAENPIRGTVEKVYALPTPPSLSAEDLAGMDKAAYEQAFMVYIATLLRDVQRYLATKQDDEALDVLADGVELSKVRLFLTDDELRDMNSQITKLMMKAVENTPTPERKPRIFSFLFLPGISGKPDNQDI